MKMNLLLKKVLKQGIIISILLGIICFLPNVSLKVKASVKTGHEDFLDVFFDGEGKLIVDFTEDEIAYLKDNIGKKVFGWQTKYYHYQRKVDFDGVILFTKSNKTQTPFNFEYKLTEEQVKKRSVKVNGSVSAKVTGKISKINTTITGGIDSSIGYQTEVESKGQMVTKIDIDVMPNKKITMITTGEAYVSNGYSKYYFFGITLRKGLWETIEIETIYYELREESFS